MYCDFGAATEAINDFLSSKPANEYTPMKKYLATDVNAALEGADRRGNRIGNYQSRYAAWLTRKCEEKAEKVDFGKIPDTKGDVTKWDVYRKGISKSMDIINSEYTISRSEAVLCMNDLNNFLVSCRSDFEYGYKTENNFIILTYQSLCLALLDITMLAMCEQNNAINNSVASAPMTKNVRYNGKARTLIRSVNGVINTWKSGEWARIVKYYKNTRIDMYKTNKSATEAAALESAFVGTVATVVLVAALSITGVIAIVSAIRGLITIYYRSAASVDEKARSMIAYLDEIAPYETNKDALAKQQKASAKLDKIAGFIEARIIKDDARAEAEIIQEDKAATPSDMEFATNDPNGFEFY